MDKEYFEHKVNNFKFTGVQFLCCNLIWQLLLSSKWPERYNWIPICPKCNNLKGGKFIMPKSKVKTKYQSSAVVEKNRADEVRDLLIQATTRAERTYVDIALLSYEAYTDRLYKNWGYTEFEDFVEKELKMEYRKLKYFIKIGNKVKDLNLPQDRLEKIGWSKISVLTGILDPDNVDEWLEKAEKKPIKELIADIKISKTNDPNATVQKVVTIKLTMSESVASVILDAIETAKKLTESDNQALALEMICSDWLETQDAVPERTALEDKISYIQRAYGVNVSVDTSTTTPSIDTTDVKSTDTKDAVSSKEESVIKDTVKEDAVPDTDLEDVLIADKDVIVADNMEKTQLNIDTEIDEELSSLLDDVV